MSIEKIDASIKEYLNISNPVNITIFIILLCANLAQDYVQSGKFIIGINSFLLSFNIVIYFALLHIVYTQVVEPRSKRAAKDYNNDKFEIELEIPDNEEKKNEFYYYFTALLGIAIVNFGFSYKNINDKNLLVNILILILLTTISEYILVSGVFNNKVSTLCEATLNSMGPF
jgi:hypothetical protein